MDDAHIVSPSWLADRLAEPGLAVVDVREPWAYDGIGHVPGAVNVPYDRIRDEAGDAPGHLPEPDAFAAALSAAGVEPGDTIVAYDDTFGVFAARFVLTARAYGHDDARLLDGDYSAWTRAHETTTATPAIEPTTYDVGSLDPSASPLVDAASVADAIDDGALLVDTRDPDEFAAGHLPGAIRFDWREVVDEERRRLKPRAELETLLAERGITPDRELVLYCNTARRISHTYAVLRALGYADVAFYEGSLTDWRAADRPIETGPAESTEPAATD